MANKMTKLWWPFIFFIPFLLLGSLTGCDQFREKLANFISPEQPMEILKSARLLFDAGKFKEVKVIAAANLEKKNGELPGEFALLAARAAAMSSDVEDSLRYLKLADEYLDLDTDELMNDPAFESLLTNIRFLQIVVGQGKSKIEASKPAFRQYTNENGLELNSGGGSSIKMDAKGTEVRAGDVVIKIPK